MRGLDFDTMIAAYLVNPNARGLSLSALALARLGIEMTPIESLIGKGKNQITMDLVPIDAVARYAGEDAVVRIRPRARADNRDHAPSSNARAASSTPALASSGPASATSHAGSPVEGSITSVVAPSAAAIRAPPSINSSVIVASEIIPATGMCIGTVP